MTTRTFSSYPSNSTDAYFRAWITGLSGSFSAFGWVQASDTGQINKSTVTMPAAINTAQGFEIWRMDDALQAAAPVFVKIEYGSGSAINNPAIWLTIGTGTNGLGTLTGVLFSRTQIACSGSTTNASTTYCSGGASRLTAYMWGGSTSASYVFGFSLERTHDASGADTSVGLQMFWATYSAKYSQYLPFSGIAPTSYAAWNCVVPPTGGGACSPDIHVYPVRCWTPGESYPAWGAVAYVGTDFTMGSSLAVVGHDGAARTYLCVGTNGPAVTYGQTGYIAWRYD